jgi:hypothetical protein
MTSFAGVEETNGTESVFLQRESSRSKDDKAALKSALPGQSTEDSRSVVNTASHFQSQTILAGDFEPQKPIRSMRNPLRIGSKISTVFLQPLILIFLPRNSLHGRVEKTNEELVLEPFLRANRQLWACVSHQRQHTLRPLGIPRLA